jgi:hypothetical protein
VLADPVSESYGLAVPAEQVDDDAQRPTERSWFSSWLLGKREYIHPVLRWAEMPTFRVGMVALFVFVSVDGEAHRVLRVVGLMLLGTSILAGVVNEVLLRSRRRANQR